MTDPEKAEYERVIGLLTAKVEELLAANERLTSELTAHQTLKALYSDSTQPAMVRLRAAQAALNVESPALKPVEPPLDLVAEPIIPLAELVAIRRKRADELLALPLSERERLVRGVGRDDGNGSDDSSD